MADTVIGRSKVSVEVASRLRDEIIAGELLAGQPLRLVAIAERLGVSTTPVREALAMLERQGLADSHTNRGFVVASISPRDVGDAYAVAAFIQRVLTERAANRFSDQDLDELEELDKHMKAATREGDDRIASDMNHEIHRRIGLAADSPLMVRFLRETTPFLVRRNDPDVPGWADQRLEGHGSILQALRSRDGATAGEMMEKHLLRSGDAAQQFAEVNDDGRAASPRRGRAKARSRRTG